MVLFEKNVKKMIIVDEKHNSKYLVKAPQLSLSSIVEKKLYNGLFKDKYIEMKDVWISNVLSNEIQSSWQQHTIKISLQNASLTCYCEACKSNNCNHIFSTFKIFEKKYLNATSPLIEQFKELSISYDKAIANIDTIKNNLLKLDDYELFVNQFCKTFNNFTDLTNVYYLLSVCMINEKLLEDRIFEAIKRQSNKIYENFKTKYVDLYNYCKFFIYNSREYRFDLHKFYLLYLIAQHRFEDLMNDMYQRLNKHEVLSFDEKILQNRTIDLVPTLNFLNFYLDFSKRYYVKNVDLKIIVENLKDDEKKDFILNCENASIMVQYRHLFKDSEQIKNMKEMISAQQHTLFLNYIIQLYPLVENKEFYSKEILKLLMKMYHDMMVSFSEQELINQFLDLLPHNTYLHSFFTNHNPLLKESDIDE